jgi:hypothetical protein
MVKDGVVVHRCWNYSCSRRNKGERICDYRWDFENVSKKQVYYSCSGGWMLIAMLLKKYRQENETEIRKLNKYKAYSFE